MKAIGLLLMVVFSWQGFANEPCDLSSLIHAAKGNFRALSDLQMEQSRRQLGEALSALEISLRSAGETQEAAWKKYLRWGDLASELKKGNEARVDALKTILSRFYEPYAGLERAEFRAARNALRNYGALLEMRQAADPHALYEKRLDQLQSLVDGRRPSAIPIEEESDISEIESWLAATGLSPDLSSCLARSFGYSNARITFSKDLIPASIFQPIHETSPVSEFLFGAYVSGTSDTTSVPALEFIPDEKTADIELTLKGQTISHTVSQKRRVSVGGTMVTDHDASEAIYFGGNQWRSLSAHVNAQSRGSIDWVYVDRWLGWRLVQAMAFRRAVNLLPDGEAHASSEAEESIARQIEAKTSDFVEKVNSFLSDFLISPMLRRGSTFPLSHTSTTARSLTAELKLARGEELTASAPPPELKPDLDLETAVHESVAPNLIDSTSQGLEIKDSDVAAVLGKIYQNIPPALRPGADKDRWFLTLAPVGGMVFRFRNNRIEMNFHIASFTRLRSNPSGAAESYSGNLRIQMTYAFHIGRELQLERVLPPVITTSGAISPDLLAFIQDRGAAIFSPLAEIPNLTLGGGSVFPQPIKLNLSWISAQNGWLDIGWSRASHAIH